ncbi:Uncharacterized protein TCM_031857 [Theobroma cacao]|uniref:Uncharacterized protein n=1 Tax=Theobroma cacao TaxID=3641 RepID=A0A061F7I7_THECC|nr:Uncharacterized protein TCM_031857 [Theobroma cacao]
MLMISLSRAFKTPSDGFDVLGVGGYLKILIFRILSQLTNLTFLEVLNLSLVGPIPPGKQFDTFENDSYSGNLGLCDLQLSKQCGNPEPKPPVALLKEDEGSEIAFIWKVVMMGYGCGVVLGFNMGYIVFTTGRPWWFIKMVERDWQKNVTN